MNSELWVALGGEAASCISKEAAEQVVAAQAQASVQQATDRARFRFGTALKQGSLQAINKPTQHIPSLGQVAN